LEETDTKEYTAYLRLKEEKKRNNGHLVNIASAEEKAGGVNKQGTFVGLTYADLAPRGKTSLVMPIVFHKKKGKSGLTRPSSPGRRKRRS